jgi:hypothetical protein
MEIQECCEDDQKANSPRPLDWELSMRGQVASLLTSPRNDIFFELFRLLLLHYVESMYYDS